jgi:tRNA threonylcarbamoyladenosine biosynthesis protein TsaB
MIVLGLDTATHTAGIAIVDSAGDRVLAECRHDTSGRGADLLVKLDELCRGAGVAPTAFDAIAIGAGPGSFTGLRIGMATAKGIAFAAQRPLWAVSSLAALADDARREVAPAEPILCAALDARRGEVFAGCFWRGVALAPERVLAPRELGPWIAELARAADPSASGSPATRSTPIARSWRRSPARSAGSRRAHRRARPSRASRSRVRGSTSRWAARPRTSGPPRPR